MLEETIVAVRGLLAGDEVELHGREVTVDGLRLVHPPTVVPPIVTGVVRPRSLELSGRVADGTIIAEGNGPAELAAARQHIDKGRAAGDRPAHEVVTFAFLRVDDDPARAVAVTRDVLAGQAEWLGVPADELFALIGPAGTVPARVAALHAAGAGTVVLRPLGPDPAGQARAALAAVTLG
jgi:alkanesulfonate monooxygenase SsuD/methylene tetrahydromethanopterin reductase-like flavin-dependent oxidoreductase (luciferase family)